uniref:hypothetical protein n=1 Tax=Micromonospora sp. NBC_00855 TaxID=2975978 RepID=UPI00225615CC|nr:hypothetical protein OHB51_35345 [Micromonospora sp. NBC_00855]
MVTQLALPAPPTRLALPWGDSAYTSAVYERHPTEWWPVPNWCLGPIENGLTPSGEGPRRRDEAEARVLDQMVERARAKRLDRMLADWGDIAPGEPLFSPDDYHVGDRDAWADVPYSGPMPFLGRGDRVGWTDRHGELHTGVVTDRRNAGRGTELDIAPDEEGSAP